MAKKDRHAPSQARQTDIVESGLYRLSLVRGGWRVPCRILHRFGWSAEIDERVYEAVDDPFQCAAIRRIHDGGEKIDQETYDWLIEMKRWAEREDSSHPAINPLHPIDHMSLRPLLPREDTWTKKY